MSLRLTNLDLKAIWADEWATLVFSLGNSFKTIPLDEIITLDTVLEPVKVYSENNLQDVVNNLLGESTHPPVYFVLSHLWIKLFSPAQELVSLDVARTFSAIFGILAIPAIFFCGLLISNSLLIGQFAAALIAFSPYSIYLAQEVRHYTLTILLLINSLFCLMSVIKAWHQKQQIPIILALAWIVINSLGVATHYFFSLALVAQTLVLLTYLIRDIQSSFKSAEDKPKDQSRFYLIFRVLVKWRNVGFAILGTIAGCLVWVYTWLNIP